MKGLAADVFFLLNLFDPDGITADDAEELGRLLGSREEFVAYVLLRRPTIMRQPAILPVLLRLAKVAPRLNLGSGAQSVNRSDAEAADRLRTSLEKFIRQDPTKGAADSVSDTLRQIAMESSGGLTRFADRITVR